MKTIALVGKVDCRIIAYPLARALSLLGLTSIVTDDGAYRRLYHGSELTGTVSGVDISVAQIANEELLNSLSNSGVPYDYKILVSSGYIPDGIDGVLLCHGIDKSITAKIEDKPKEDEEDTRVQKPKVEKKRGFGKKAVETENSDTTESEHKEDESSEIEGLDSQEVKAEVKVERDKFEVPDGITSKEVIVSFESSDKKGSTAISMKDAAIKYIFSCEERKELLPLEDKNFIKLITGLVSDILDIPQTELTAVFNRKEYLNSGKVK